MNLRLKLRPTRIETRGKPLLTSFYRGSFGVCYSKYMSNAVYREASGEEYAVVCNYEKHRKKSQRFGVNGKKLKKPSITPAKYVCYYYKIPVSLLKMMNKRVVQGNRNFWFEDLK